MSENEEYVGSLIAAILASDNLDQSGWEEFSLVIAFDESEANRSYGYSYDAQGEWEAFSVRPRLINAEAVAYRDWLKLEDDKAIIKMLIQFNRVTNRFNADFEYEDPARWKVAPSNINEITRELRPNLGG